MPKMVTLGNFGVIYEEAHRSHVVEDNEHSGSMGQEIDASGVKLSLQWVLVKSRNSAF